MHSVDYKIYARIIGHGKGYAFSNKDFADIGARGSIDVALSKLAATGKIRRIARGLYDYPRYNAELGGELSPDMHQAALAIARSTSMRIQPSGALAANMLGLSTQVPAQIVYLTDGRSRKIAIGKMDITFKHVPPGKLQQGTEITALVTNAIRHLGKNAIDEPSAKALKQRFTASDCQRLLKNARYVEGWIYDEIRRIVSAGDK